MLCKSNENKDGFISMSVNRAILPAPLYTAEQTRVLDSTAITKFDIPGIKLMQRAGHAVFAEIIERFPKVRRLTIMCGGGNNGGDGFVVALLAIQKGFDVQLVCVGDDAFIASLHGEAKEAWELLEEINFDYEIYQAGMFFSGELIVDALLGTGLSGPVYGLFEQAIAQINRSPSAVFAVDIPSGLCADTGAVLGVAVKADVTLSFIGMKRGLFTFEAVDYCGELLFDDLKLPEDVYDCVPVNLFRTTDRDLKECLPARERRAHKGCFGHVLVIGGNLGMGGAALLAAEAAIRSGAGLVSLATHPEHVTASLSRCPEVMVKGVRGAADLNPLLDKADVIVLGPGLGQNAWSDQMLYAAVAAKKPMVLDADALNLMALNDRLRKTDQAQKRHWIFTPHPGEAARMLGETVALIERDRFASVERLQRHCGGAVILKGAGSLVSAGEACYLCSEGNPGMAVGGMGDVLSGICGALLSQGLSPESAARVGVYIHAKAADMRAGIQGEAGLLASDLFLAISAVINGKCE